MADVYYFGVSVTDGPRSASFTKANESFAVSWQSHVRAEIADLLLLAFVRNRVHAKQGSLDNAREAFAVQEQIGLSEDASTDFQHCIRMHAAPGMGFLDVVMPYVYVEASFEPFPG